MARTGRRQEWPPVRAVRLIPGAREKGVGKSEPPRPYREPTQVPLGEKPQAYRVIRGQGTRQISPVTSGEGVPVVLG